MPRHYHGLPAEHEDAVLPHKRVRGRVHIKHAFEGGRAACRISNWVGINPDHDLALQGRQVARQLGQLPRMVLIFLRCMVAVVDPRAHKKKMGAILLCLPPVHVMDAVKMQSKSKHASLTMTTGIGCTLLTNQLYDDARHCTETDTASPPASHPP